MLLATKLCVPPPRLASIARLRLIEQITEGSRHPLTLVASPAGFGKTTLLSDWAAQQPFPVGWLTLDAGDNDLIRFWRYFIAALQPVWKGIGQEALDLLQAFSTSEALPFEPVLTALINDMIGVATHAALVLDDYHAVQARVVHETLAFLVDHLPPRLHLVIATRVDLPLPLARWRLEGRLFEIRTAELRFTEQEAATLLAQMGLSLSPAEVAALVEHTEGWAAGLQLAALSMRGARSVREFIATFTGSNRYIADYLTEEVLNQQPEDVQRFLLCTSILDTLTASLCDALVDRHDSQAVLEMLERNNIFLIPLDEQRAWYRYHSLFADLLRYRLRLTEAALIPDLHRRAAAWYAQHHIVSLAARHTASAQDASTRALDPAAWRATNEAAHERLSTRELEVLHLMAEGLSNQDIARRLFIGVTTVKKHSTNIFGKLAVKSRAQAVAEARRRGLLA